MQLLQMQKHLLKLQKLYVCRRNSCKRTDSDVDGIIKTTTDVNNKDDQNNTVKSKDYR